MKKRGSSFDGRWCRGLWPGSPVEEYPSSCRRKGSSRIASRRTIPEEKCREDRRLRYPGRAAPLEASLRESSTPIPPHKRRPGGRNSFRLPVSGRRIGKKEEGHLVTGDTRDFLKSVFARRREGLRDRDVCQGRSMWKESRAAF